MIKIAIVLGTVLTLVSLYNFHCIDESVNNVERMKYINENIH